MNWNWNAAGKSTVAFSDETLTADLRLNDIRKVSGKHLFFKALKMQKGPVFKWFQYRIRQSKF